MATNLLNLPHEVLHRILIYVDPADIARLSCCRTLYSVIKSDGLLSRELYLRHFVGCPGLLSGSASHLDRMTRGQKAKLNLRGKSSCTRW